MTIRENDVVPTGVSYSVRAEGIRVRMNFLNLLGFQLRFLRPNQLSVSGRLMWWGDLDYLDSRGWTWLTFLEINFRWGHS